MLGLTEGFNTDSAMTKVLLSLFLLSGMVYMGVIVKLVWFSDHNRIWKVSFGLLTPLLVIVLMLSNAGDVSTFIILALFVMNMIYLLSPLNSYFIDQFYQGRSNVVRKIYFGCISFSTSMLLLFVLMYVLLMIFK